MSARDQMAPDVVMVLENSQYPLDARVRMEAETLIQSGRSVEVLAPREPDRPVREVIRGVRVSRFPLPEGDGKLLGTAVEYLVASWMISAAVLPRLARKRSGTLHVHNPPDFFFLLLWFARRRGWSTVYDHHDDAAGMLRAKLARPTRAAALLAWMRDQSARAADLTITTNDTQRRLVEDVARRAIVVRNSPPLWFADHRPSRPSGRVRLVFLGEIGEQDRVERAIDILAALVADGRVDPELLVIGDGPRREAVQERARRLHVSDRLTITGWVPFEEVPALLASAHVGLDPASATDVNHGSTMVKILEYLAVGLPVVATALRETKLTGGNAIVTVEQDTVEAFATPIIELLSSTGAWQEEADKARAQGTRLMWPEQGERLLAAYRELDDMRTRDGSTSASPGFPAKRGHRARR
jgi:glycosyltransferase involved in cell wall biosynthesis